MAYRLKILLLTLISSIAAMGQVADSVQVSLITCYPGSLIYELYGHTEIRVKDGKGDRLYNYGMFDFNAPNFMYRFVKGDADYMVVAIDSNYLLYGYESRRVVEQKLNLTQSEARKIRDLLETNVQPENATYKYNYVYDNCATKPRDIIEKALPTIKYQTMPDTLTFREEMSRYNKNYPWQQFGIDMVLGSGLDKTLSYREQMFVPMILMEAMSGATVERNGKEEKLVGTTTQLNPGADEGDILPATPWWESPMAASVALMIALLIVTYHDVRRKNVTAIADSLLYGVYGLCGAIIFFLLIFSSHEATSPNVNGWWLNPFCFIPAVLVWIKNAKKALFYYHSANFAIAIIMLLPNMGIANAAFYPMIVSSAVRSGNYIYIYHNAKKKADK